jgi:hypothetical protein
MNPFKSIRKCNGPYNNVNKKVMIRVILHITRYASIAISVHF